MTKYWLLTNRQAYIGIDIVNTLLCDTYNNI